ncbi:ATP-dependent helicase [Rhodococcus fascians]|nr:ATP-dependent helicase [Rhodococcus fascians]MBY4056992.1 ATP-dependent helicase [Rhodococcus fascians]MBY4066298.1 ATP-dependent helicase [Rhodococcus fascians]
MISQADWQPASNLKLEPNAITAIRETSHNRALTAGPGAGKTEMLAQRADFLLSTTTCPYPRRILAISFKVDAARNLKDRVDQRCGYQLAARFDSHTFHAFAKRLIDRYRLALTGINALEPNYTVGDTRIRGTQITYKDMVPLALEILKKSAAARGALRQTYSHLFLDEFQDCTEQQYTLIRTAFLDTSTQVTAVGDTKQRIMGWAGALEGIFEKYSADFHAVPSNLYQNHRSKPRLRRMQNRMIAVMDPAGTAPPEDLQGEDGEVKILRFANDQDEAEHIANLITEWLKKGVPHQEIVIVISKQPHLYAAPLVQALTKHGIAYRDEHAQQDLAAEPASALILDFLRVVFDDQQPKAYQRLMKTAASYTAEEEAGSRARSAIDRYIRDCRLKVRALGFDSTNAGEIDGIAFGFTHILGREAVAALSPDYERSTRLDDVITKTMTAVHTQVAVDHDPAAALRRLSDSDAVRISTIHKSKGLEFANVVVLAVENQTFWSSPDAERAAFFVGISRAKDCLILTTAGERPWPNDPSITNWKVPRTPHLEFLSYANE